MAEIPREEFKALSPAQFFARYKEIAGFANPVRALYQTVRELVENALDATDAYGILPNIKVIIKRVEDNPNYYTITVEDNGIGIPPQHVPNAFGRVLYSSKYTLRQTRGMFGLGVKAAILYAQMTTGKPVEVITSRRGLKRIYYFKIRIDLRKNQPIILERGSWRKSREWHGTIVSLTIEGDWPRARQKVIEYIRRTATITPYANIVFVTPDEDIYFYRRTVDKLPQPPKEVKPHPHGVDLEFVKELCKSNKDSAIRDVLVNSFQGIGAKTVLEVLRLAGIDPEKKAGDLTENEIVTLTKVLKGIDADLITRLRDSTRADTVIDMIMESVVGLDRNSLRRALRNAGIDPDKNPKQLGSEEIEKLVKVLRKFYPRFKAPTSDALSPLGEDIIKAGLQRIYEPEFVEAVTRKPSAYQGHPFIVEVGIAYGGKIPISDKPILLRYANKIPLLHDERTDVSWKVIDSIDWRQYNIAFPAPIIVLTHICSTKVPYKGVGKESVADVPEVERELRLAVREAARKLRMFLSKKMKEEEKQRRMIALTRYIPEITGNLSIIAKDVFGDGVEELIQKKLVKIVSKKIGVDENKVIEILKTIKIGT